MKLNMTYRLSKGVQVRNEVFGLLFYDYRGPRLYFVPSEHLIADSFFDGKQSVATLLDRHGADMPERRQKIHGLLVRTLEQLERKGLIHGQPLC